MMLHVPSAILKDAVAIQAIFYSPNLLTGTFNLTKRRELYEARETLYQSPPFTAEHVQVRNNPSSCMSIAKASKVFHVGLSSIKKILSTWFVVINVSNACSNFSEA